MVSTGSSRAAANDIADRSPQIGTLSRAAGSAASASRRFPTFPLVACTNAAASTG